MNVGWQVLQRWITTVASIFFLWFATHAPALAEQQAFLPEDQAFKLEVKVSGSDTLDFNWLIADGYYLYKERIQIQLMEPAKDLPAAKFPEAISKFDANFNKTMAIYKHALELRQPLQPEAGNAGRGMLLEVTYQGCAEAGLCYPPQTKLLRVLLKANGNQLDSVSWEPEQNANPITPIQEKPGSAALSSSGSAPDSIAAALASGSLLRTVGLFWIAGLLLSFTPCVLPMVPILSSLIAGQKTQLTRRQGFTLAASYSLGMAIVYAGFGVLAGLAGEGLAAALQNPWVLGAFALMLFLLALSMFDVYQLQMPASIQSKTTELANRLPGGNLIGVFVMGGISALVIGPCVAAPLAGALVYISQTRDVMLGGAALFAMALGMSVPLLLVGMSAGTLLPRAGAWMEYVKQFFGMMLIAVALWIVSPVLPAGVNILLWALLLLFAATLLGAFQGRSIDSASGHGAKLIKTLGLASALMAGILLVSAASGGQSLLQPLAHLKYASQTSDQSKHGLDFQRIASSKELDTELATAQKQGKAVMLDFYADWCVACKEYDALTFSNSQVQSRLKNVKLLQVDVTKNNAEDKALLKRFSLFGPPGIVFFKANGAATPSYKVVGFESTQQFMSSLDKAL